MAGKKFSPLQLISVFQSLVCQVRSPHWTPIFLAGFRNTVHARVREIWKISRVVVRDFSRRRQTGRMIFYTSFFDKDNQKTRLIRRPLAGQ